MIMQLDKIYIKEEPILSETSCLVFLLLATQL